ncbi:hypothetical protein EVAR_61101_1 [Eumeta japonica]|uniref:Uncharacterized protein n=1 Tax=Eumeta variegata TaxID=151549 RepID=A0A4C1YR45_EUMVA|nr:hypothetical protein EVAR_61101_1 [Eumeta japonica]
MHAVSARSTRSLRIGGALRGRGGRRKRPVPPPYKADECLPPAPAPAVDTSRRPPRANIARHFVSYAKFLFKLVPDYL